MAAPFISICIPAYKRIAQLRRLLDSIVDQTYKEYEVIVTDDSPDASVQELCKDFESLLPLKYFRNSVALGTPENWNEGLRKAEGKWIKIMHDDDWFLSPDSLSVFARTAAEGTGSLIFSAYDNVQSSSNKGATVWISNFRYNQLKRNPVSIISKNCIGPPSVTMFEREPFVAFERRMKWLVDMDFYVRILEQRRPLYIRRSLIGIGIHDTQVTVSSSLNPSVEIPEHLLFLQKAGVHSFRNILFYDAYWRLFRNLRINTPEKVRAYAEGVPLPPSLMSLLQFQSSLPFSLLSNGVLSKMLMTCSYLRSLWS